MAIERRLTSAFFLNILAVARLLPFVRSMYIKKSKTVTNAGNAINLQNVYCFQLVSVFEVMDDLLVELCP